ncbi:MAG: hypothetical protein MMC23_000089 [Stictis urceolatum]|nr:hypothetical protein [Stictis urceolata]
MAAQGAKHKLPLQRTVYVGTFIHCTSLTELDVLENTAIGVDEHGIIAFVEGDVKDDLTARVNAHGWKEPVIVRQDPDIIGFWFPGFVDTHIHASQFPNTGIFGKTTLLSWLNTYTFPLESSLESLPKAHSVYKACILSTLSQGTTTASYFATTHVTSTNLLATLCHSLGQRAFIGRCAMDSHIHPDYYHDSSPSSALEATKATIVHIDALDPGYSLITPIITPRFAPSCTAPLMSLLGDLHRETGLPIQTHISENRAEIALVRELHPEQDSYAGVYDHHGLLTPKTVLAHGIHFSDEERALVQARGASISHCPVSNSYLASGICPVRELLDAGIPVGLGTDVSGGWSPSLLVAAREAGGVSRLRSAVAAEGVGQEGRDRLKLSVEETLFLATGGGAKCLGLEGRVGAFGVGMEWDAQFVDLGRECGFGGVKGEGKGEVGRGNVQVWEEMGWDERINKWIFCGDDRNTKAVWVKGRLVSGKFHGDGNEQ